MQIENSLKIDAPPDRVYEFLLDVNRVVGCVPGAELSEVVDADTFKGKVKIKVGPVTVSYNGIARITSRDAATRAATIQAEGKETTGSGSAQATTVMSVVEEGAGSTVTFATDFTVVGRIAQFGRGIMEDVSRHLVGQMGECIRQKLEAPEGAPGAQAGEADGSGDQHRDQGTSGSYGDNAAPLDAFALGRAVARDRVSRLSERPQLLAMVAAAIGLVLIVALLRRRRG
jgi:hypothetical protein